MNKDDIAQMMQDSSGMDWGTEAHFQRFAALVAAAERERLAKALDHQCRGMSDYFEVKWIRELATALRRNQ